MCNESQDTVQGERDCTSSPDVAETATPFYIFYDCETTGLNTYSDSIVEVAAKLFTGNMEFSQLIHTSARMNTKAQQKTGITPAMLTGKPKLSTVMSAFMQWLKDSITDAERQTGLSYSPTLVAHNGCVYDFPILLHELHVRGLLDHYVEEMNAIKLQFADTLQLCRKLKSEKIAPFLEKNQGLSQEALFKLAFPGQSYNGHRALADVKALISIFKEQAFRNHLNRMEVKSADRVVNEWRQKFDIYKESKHIKLQFANHTMHGRNIISLSKCLVLKLIQNHISYEDLDTLYQQHAGNMQNFKTALSEKGIKNRNWCNAMCSHFQRWYGQ
ncbi:DNA polymerase III PolC-type-like isoform X1 [Ptychodera flava]|uniref:DNA polymerase III PolC-type-like isoform X1 n=1 Tax=Ptychodera flava TaxID=63121 RepID=UPI003969D21E